MTYVFENGDGETVHHNLNLTWMVLPQGVCSLMAEAIFKRWKCRSSGIALDLEGNWVPNEAFHLPTLIIVVAG